MKEDLPQRFYWLDALRGLAAIAIVIHHYHHFYLKDAFSRREIPPIETFPYTDFIGPLYGAFAANAVQLFWLISGFVFAHVYLRRPVSARGFAVARFARLYPLHFVTLLYVAVLQLLSLNFAGNWQVYGNNDIRHFFLQLFMSSNWNTWSRGLSFNGPIWSVSLEIVVYGMFFMSLFALKWRPVLVSVTLASVCWFWVVVEPIRLPIIRTSVFECAGYFFIGTACYVVQPLNSGVRFFGVVGSGICAFLLGLFAKIDALVLPSGALILLCLAIAMDWYAPKVGRRLKVLGDISYSVYLIHVPLQMSALLIADLAFDGTRLFADNYATLPIYLGASVILAYAIHRWFERPVDRAIRSYLSGN